MKSFDEMEYHPTSEKLVKTLVHKTQYDNPLFYRVMVAYYFSLVASMMRCNIQTLDRGLIPVNLYALNLSPSGSGKGFSTNIIENQVIGGFRHRFLEQTFPMLAEKHLPRIAMERAQRHGRDPDQEILAVEREFLGLGPLLFSFDSATPAAIKQMRHKMLMAQGGSMCLQIDEIGRNLLANQDALNTCLELYDVGTVKTKLIKSTTENLRNEEIIGRTPTNMILFGTPTQLLNGGKTEEELYEMLETGYARRCFFGYGRVQSKSSDLTSEQILEMMTSQEDDEFLLDLSDQIEELACPTKVNTNLTISRETTLALIEYRLQCEGIANKLPEHEEIKKAEISHRYFKALKLAGAYAFVDGSSELTEDHLYQAIKLAEESGEAFLQILTRERPYVKLAKYIATAKKELTQADLVEDLPFYKGSVAAKNEMMSLAIAWGHKNNTIIKKAYSDGVEFLRGETLEETDLNKLIVSYSQDITEGYEAHYAPFDKLHQMTCAPGIHWVNHHLNNGYRSEENAIAGFNILVIDVDGGSTTIPAVQKLLQKYKYLIYTTKSHSEEKHSFRLIIPMNYTLKMGAKEFKEFMNNIYEWLPFEVDTATSQRARKWLAHPGTYYYGNDEGELLDVLPFIPETSKNEERKEVMRSQQDMDNLERWVLNNTGDGNRNNMLLRYGMILVDIGFDIGEINARVVDLNNKMADKLDEAEIMNTIMISVSKAITNKGNKK